MIFGEISHLSKNKSRIFRSKFGIPDNFTKSLDLWENKESVDNYDGKIKKNHMKVSWWNSFSIFVTKSYETKHKQILFKKKLEFLYTENFVPILKKMLLWVWFFCFYREVLALEFFSKKVTWYSAQVISQFSRISLVLFRIEKLQLYLFIWNRPEK